jgi:hypothetical protein
MGQTAEFAAGSWIVRQPPGEKKQDLFLKICYEYAG